MELFLNYLSLATEIITLQSFWFKDVLLLVASFSSLADFPFDFFLSEVESSLQN